MNTLLMIFDPLLELSECCLSCSKDSFLISYQLERNLRTAFLVHSTAQVFVSDANCGINEVGEGIRDGCEFAATSLLRKIELV